MTDVNPFVYDDPLPPGELVDREEEAARMLALAEGGHNTRLSAPRRYGKTTLLLKVLHDADRAGLHTVYVDFYRALTVAEISRRIEEAYARSLRGPLERWVTTTMRSWRARVRVAPGGVGAELEHAGEAGTQRLANLLDLPKRVFERDGVRTVVVFDEFQDFLRAQGEIDGLFRSKIQFHRDEASYVFAGSEPGLLAALFGDRRRPLFDQARPLDLGPLADADIAGYVDARFAASGRDAGEALDGLLDLARGHPQRAMLLAHHLWERTPRGARADAETVETVLETVDRETRERFEQTWAGLARAPNQRKVLAALAAGDETLYNKRTLARFGLDKGAAESALRPLVASGEVVRTDAGPLVVDPLLERWLRRTQGGPA